MTLLLSLFVSCLLSLTAATSGDGTGCTSLYEDIPGKCGDVSSYSTIAYRAYTDPDDFITTICEDDDCAKTVYEYIQCANETEATYIDFLCSKSAQGTVCAKLISDMNFESPTKGVCADTTVEQCSPLCKTAIQGFQMLYGCCLYTRTALRTNVTFSNAIWAQCGIDNPGVCDGGISNSPISVPGSDVESAALAPVFYSTLLIIPAYLLAMLV